MLHESKDYKKISVYSKNIKSVFDICSYHIKSLPHDLHLFHDVQTLTCDVQNIISLQA